MALNVICPGCDSQYPVAEELVGKTIKCKKCGELVKVVAPRPAKAAPAEARPVAARRMDDEDDERPVRKSSRRRRDDDEDDRSTKGSKLPMLIGSVIGVVLLVGGVVGGFMFMGGENPPVNPPVAGTDAGGLPGEVAAAPGGPGAPQADVPVVPAKASAPAASVQETKTASSPKTESEPAVKAEPPTKPATPTVVAAAPVATPQTPVPPAYAPVKTRLDPLSAEAVKKASVFIKVDANVGSATGSGWFGMEPGLVFTNAHVLFMKAPNSPEPKKITLILNSGTPEQREIPNSRIKILAVDRSIDLALLQVVNENNLPLPLKVRPSLDLNDGQLLYTIGYPFGYLPAGVAGQSRREPEVSVRPTAFTAFRRDDLGELRRIQLEGGANPGNSGGPVVDVDGNVMSVIVEGVHGGGGGSSGIALTMGVPTEYCFGILNGRIGTIEYGTPYRAAGKVKIPIKAKCIDPLGRLQKVGVRAWIADSNEKTRLPGPKPASTLPSDSDTTDITLKYDSKTKEATGEVTMSELPTGRAYFAQPYYSYPSNGQLMTSYMAGLKIPMSGPPVDRTPADLVVKFKPGTTRHVSMTNSISIEENEEGEGGGKNERLSIKTTLKVNEQVIPPDSRDQNQAARLRFQFESIEPKVEIGAIEEDVFPKSIVSQLNRLINQAEAIGLVNKQGEMYRYQINTLAIPNPLEQQLTLALGAPALDALVGTSIPLPNRRVNANESWTSTKDVRLMLFEPPPRNRNEKPKPPREYKYRDEITFTYIGQRARGGKKEAVVKIEGKPVQAAGTKESVFGEMKGYALVELDSGIVVEADIEKEFEVDTSSGGVKKRLTVGNHYNLKRGSAN